MAKADDKVRLRVGVTPEQHKELRVLAAQSGMSMGAYGEAVIAEAIERKRVLKPNGKKDK